MPKENYNVRKLTVTAGTTYYITLPQTMIRKLKWKKGEKKSVEQYGEGILIRDWDGK